MRFKAKLAGYTNGSHSKCYLEHSQNQCSDANTRAVPAIFGVNDKELVERIKELPVNTELMVTIRRYNGYTHTTVLEAELLDFEVIKMPQRNRKKQNTATSNSSDIPKKVSS